MSQEAIQKLIERLSSDSEFFKSFHSDPQKHLIGYDLTINEKELFIKMIKEQVLVDPGDRKECSFCGKTISIDCYNAAFTKFRLGTTHTDSVTRYYFHQECYEKGKRKLIGQLSTFPPGAGIITCDSRDPDGIINPQEALKKVIGGIDFTNTLPSIIWKFIKANWLLIMISLLILSEIIRRYVL